MALTDYYSKTLFIQLVLPGYYSKNLQTGIQMIKTLSTRSYSEILLIQMAKTRSYSKTTIQMAKMFYFENFQNGLRLSLRSDSKTLPSQMIFG